MSLQHLYIVTGSSRGMGAAIVQQLLKPGHTVLGIARRSNAELADLATRQGATLLQWSHDLADPLPLAERLQAWLGTFAPGTFASAHLINNAGVVTHPGPIQDTRFTELSNAIRVGLESCLLLSAAFLAGTRDWPIDKRVLNISSGLGRRAMAGSAPYCAAKAGMDNLSQAMALDEALLPHGARVVSLAPGIIDTDMQTQLRQGEPDKFPDQAVFAQFKASGALSSPEDAAKRVLDFLARSEFGQPVLADVRHTA